MLYYFAISHYLWDICKTMRIKNVRMSYYYYYYYLLPFFVPENAESLQRWSVKWGRVPPTFST